VTFALGDPVDLLAGLRPHFAGDLLPWRVPEGRPLCTEAPVPPDGPVVWEPPLLSLHESVAGLLSAIFDYSVVPMVGLDGPLLIAAGPLMTGARRDLSGLEDRMGLELRDRPGGGYLLAALRGQTETAWFTPEWLGLNRKLRIRDWLTPAGRHAMARLRLVEMRREGHELYGDLTARQAARYLDYFESFGTHLVRSITRGACLFQVFELDPALLPGLRQMIGQEAGGTRVSGHAVYGFAHFTRAPWVLRASPVLSAGTCPYSEAVARDALWQDDAGGASLLSARARDGARRQAVLDRLPARTAVAVSFACQALYLEDHRADAWTRLFRAGLSHAFPDLHQTGWRPRGSFAPAPFLASAGLTGAAALCQGPSPALPSAALALDLTQTGPVAPPERDHLALFAATGPGTGGPMLLDNSWSHFDPARIKIPVLDGAVQVATRDGARYTLAEGVWLGSSLEGRPSIVAAPAEPAPDLLIRCKAHLTAHVALIERMQGPALLPATQVFMRRLALWLTEATRATPRLAGLHWAAMQAHRGIGTAPPPVAPLAGAQDLAQALQAGLALLALPPDSAALDEATRDLARLVGDLYRAQPQARDAVTLDAQSRAASAALTERFAAMAGIAGLPDRLVTLCAAGAALDQPPDPRGVPHAALPGGEPCADLWNVLLALRQRLSECRAVLAAGRGDPAEAAQLVAREALSARDGPADPARAFVATVRHLGDGAAWLGAIDIEGLSREIAALAGLRPAATLLRRQAAVAPAALEGLDPQIRRLLLMLDLLNLAAASGLPMAPLDSLAPPALAQRADAALAALTTLPTPA